MDQEPTGHLSAMGEARLSNYEPAGQHDQPHDMPTTFRDLSHDVRTSLAIVTLLCGNLDLFYDQLPDDERRRMIVKLRAEMARLNELVNDVLALGSSGGSATLQERPTGELAAKNGPEWR
jgi:K+-sensing histidine kinase KdpD